MVAPALFDLALVAGVMNPFALVISLIVLGTIAGAAVGNLLSNYLIANSIQNENSDCLVQDDPNRFNLTDKEAENLIKNGIDPIKVKCAILAIRSAIGSEAIEPYLSLRSDSTQKYLDLLRDVRAGKCSNVQINGLYFDCKAQSKYYISVSGSPSFFEPE